MHKRPELTDREYYVVWDVPAFDITQRELGPYTQSRALDEQQDIAGYEGITNCRVEHRPVMTFPVDLGEGEG